MNKQELKKAQDALKQQLGQIRIELKEVNETKETLWDKYDKIDNDLEKEDFKQYIHSIRKRYDELSSAETYIVPMIINLEYILTGKHLSPKEI